MFVFSTGLKGSAEGGGHPGGPTFNYTFSGDPHAIFAEFFGGRSPFDHFFPTAGDDFDPNDPFGAFGMGGMGGMGGFHRAFKPHPGGPHRAHEKRQDPPVVHELNVSLEEVFSGCTKKMKISRKRLNPDGCTMHKEDKILTVNIKRGWKEGTKITFPKEGDETPTNIPADVVFVVKDRPHHVFRREGSDIVYPAKITLREVSEHSDCRSLLETQRFLKLAVVFAAGVVWVHSQSPHLRRQDHHRDLQRGGQTRDEEAHLRRRASVVKMSREKRRHDLGLQR